MLEFNLITKNHKYSIASDGINRDPDPSLPLVVDPSLTFHKHFEIPADVNRDRNKVMVEMFSRYLPTDLSDYQFQFVTQQSSEESNLQVLGLAIKNEDLLAIKEESTSEDVYFLETLLRNPDQNSISFLELNLPGGTFLGVFDREFLTFIRYQQNPTEEALSKTRNFIRDEFEEIDRTDKVPAFPENQAGGQDWIESVREWITDAFPRQKRIRSRKRGGIWQRWRTSAWTLLVLIMITILSWGAYEYYRIQLYRNWMQKGAKALIGTREDPYSSLTNKISQLQKKVGSGTEDKVKVYPRLALIDKHIHKSGVHLLQARVRESQIQLIFMTKSLQNADDLKNNLLEEPSIKRTEIVSTQSQDEDQFQYKVTLNIMWQDQK